MRRAFPARPDRGSVVGRAVLSKAVAHIPSFLGDPEYTYGHLAQVTGFRAGFAVPMLKDGRVIGAMTVFRLTPGPFSDRQMALLQTFADQAVIAIENVRLFTELEARNRDLTAALEQQTATAEILRAISSSPTDTTPVFETIVRNAARLCNATASWIHLLRGEWLDMVAPYNVPPGVPTRIHVEDAPHGTRVIREGVIFHVADWIDTGIPDERARLI